MNNSNGNNGHNFDKEKQDSAILNKKNIQAWDELYGSTSDLVWGANPVEVIESFLERVRPGLNEQSRSLDAASGEGRNTGLLLNLPGKVAVCDASKSALEKISPAVSAKIEKFKCLLSEMPFDSDSHDLVLAWDIIETLPDPKPALLEICRILKPGGHFLCNVPDLDDGISEIDMTCLKDREYSYRNRYFFRFMEKSNAVELLTNCGFENMLAETCDWYEKPHSGFRDKEHKHTSNVFLSIKK
jgi:ubiquinone/menaquinone biosynthesis C-methylase UbiE